MRGKTIRQFLIGGQADGRNAWKNRKVLSLKEIM